MRNNSLKSIPTEPNHYADAGGNIYQYSNDEYRECFQWINHDGYNHVRIHSGTKNKTSHRLICAAYHGLPPDIISGQRLEESSYHVHHRNSNKTDNRPENLQWIAPDVHHVVTTTINDYNQIYMVTDTRTGFRFPYGFRMSQLVNLMNQPQEVINVLLGGSIPEKIIYNSKQIEAAAITGKLIAGIYELEMIYGTPSIEPKPAPLFTSTSTDQY